MSSLVSLVFCQKNLELYGDAVRDLISRNYPDVEIKIESCVDKCGLCSDVPFALRHNAVVAGKDARELYLKLEQGMQFLSRSKLPGTAGYKETEQVPVL